MAGYFRVQGARDVEDLTSEVFLGVFRNIRTFSGSQEDFRTWVFSVAHRRLIDERRRIGRRPTVVEAYGDEPEGATSDASEQALARMSSERVERLCAALAPAQRGVLLLCDLTIEQVAALLGKSIGSTKALQRRGLHAMHRNLERGVSL